MKTLLYLMAACLLMSCNGNDDDPAPSNNNNNNNSSSTPESYMIVDNGDTIPIKTASVNFSDSTRTIFQVNFEDDNHLFGVVYTVSDPIDATKNYTTTDDRFFTSQSGAAVADSVNVYVTDFNNDINYISTTGNTVAVTKNSDGSHLVVFTGVSFFDEAQNAADVTITARAEVAF